MRRIYSKIPYFSHFDALISTSTFRQSTVTFAGTAINGALGAVFYILAARFLGPSYFGLLNVAITTLTLTADVGDLGTDTGLVNFVPRYAKNEPEKANKFIKLGLEVKVIVSLFVFVLGYILSPFLARGVFEKPELINPLRIAFLGVGTLLIFSLIVRSLQAFQRFWSWSILQITTNTLRIFLMIAVLFGGLLTIESTIWVYILMPLFGFIIGLFIISPNFLKVKNEWQVAREFFTYNKWVAVFSLLAAVGARLDTFISARLLDSVELGIYSAAQQMVKIVPMIVVALGTVIAPKMASMGNVKELVIYMKKTQVMVIGLASLGIFTIPVIFWLIPPIFGSEYLSSGPLFVILLFAMLVFLISVPVHMSVFYYFSYPRLFVWLSLAHVILVAGLGWFLISSFGAMGAAVTVLVGQIFNFIVPLVWVLRRIKNGYMAE